MSETTGIILGISIAVYILGFLDMLYIAYDGDYDNGVFVVLCILWPLVLLKNVWRALKSIVKE